MNEPLNDFNWKTQRSAIDPETWHSKGLDEKTVVSIRRALVLADKIAKLNKGCGEIDEGMLNQIIDEARAIIGKPNSLTLTECQKM